MNNGPDGPPSEASPQRDTGSGDPTGNSNSVRSIWCKASKPDESRIVSAQPVVWVRHRMTVPRRKIKRTKMTKKGRVSPRKPRLGGGQPSITNAKLRNEATMSMRNKASSFLRPLRRVHSQAGREVHSLSHQRRFASAGSKMGRRKQPGHPDLALSAGRPLRAPRNYSLRAGGVSWITLCRDSSHRNSRRAGRYSRPG